MSLKLPIIIISIGSSEESTLVEYVISSKSQNASTIASVQTHARSILEHQFAK